MAECGNDAVIAGNAGKRLLSKCLKVLCAVALTIGLYPCAAYADASCSYCWKDSLTGEVGSGFSSASAAFASAEAFLWCEDSLVWFDWMWESAAIEADGVSTRNYTGVDEDRNYHWGTITVAQEAAYTVTYDANGGTCGKASESSSSVVLPSAIRSEAVAAASSETGTVSYDYQGGAGGPVSSRFGYTVTTRTAYSLAGWYTSAAGGARVGGAGSGYSPAADVTLYAHWAESTTASNGDFDSVTLPAPTRAGYTFAGWHVGSVNGALAGPGGASYTPSSPSVTLVAAWQVEPDFALTVAVEGGPYAFTGAPIEPALDVRLDGERLESGYEVAFEDNLHAGEARVEVSYGTSAGMRSASATFAISKAPASDVSVGVSESAYVYDGAPHVPSVTASIGGNGFESFDAIAPADAVNAGEKTMTLTSPDINGDIVVAYRITPAKLTGLALVKKAVTYNAKAQKPAVSKVLAGALSVPSSAFKLAFKRSGKATSDFKSAGTLTVIATAASANYTGSASAAYTIAKATPKLAAKAVKKTVKAAAAKKKAQSLSMGVTATLGGKLSYSVVKANKAIVFKNGKATLKKGAKKGTYSIKVKASTKATASLKAASKTFTLTFAVR